MTTNHQGNWANISTNKKPLVNYNSDSESASGRIKDDKRLSTNNTRNRYGKNIKQTMQHREKEMMLLFGQKHNLKKMFHFCVPMGTSDPVPHEQFSSYQTLKKIYRPLYQNKFFPFEDMLEERKKGWQEFVELLLHHQNFINDVSKNNSSLISGIMYAEGWRKAQVPNQIVGRYINQNKLNQQMTIKGFSQDEEEAGFMKMGNFLLTVFQEKENYCPDDFSSAITYTINDFCNKAHVHNDTDNWTLIGFIPIKKDGDLAIEDFDVEGGDFVIRDLKVFIDLPKVKGITLVKYHSDHYEDKNHSFGNFDDYIIKGKRKAA
ncbi:expressed protein [Phakopsora pachyrhizi]|uniref:Expressed protein n=1 Tax=Phakopsora pachyrhizi TaxID=170000 RepID=A0AAV0BHJ8_PHAPC|nr:expressed protein [Phakopsora pachyrhizi]